MVTKSEAKEWGRVNLRGLWGIAWTPFDADDQVDEKAFREHLRRTLRLDLDGLSVVGVLAEIWHLSIDERKSLGAIAADEIGGAIPSYFSATHHSIPDTMELVHLAEEVGYDAVIVWPPYEHAHSEKEIFDYYKYVEDHSNIAIYLYNTPHSGRYMSPELVSALADLTGVAGIKFVTWDFDEYRRVKEAAGDRIVVINAKEERWLDSMIQVGNTGLISTTSINMLQTPERQWIRDYTRLAQDGELEQARELSSKLDEIRDLRIKLYDVYPNEGRHPLAETKYWVSAMGYLDNPRMRQPQEQISPEVADMISSALKASALAGTFLPGSPLA